MMWLESKDSHYCEWSWEIFNNLEKAARVKHGYASIDDITQSVLTHRDYMPSYFIAETLKYAWFCASKYDLKQLLLNTEAHLISRVSPGNSRESN